MSKPDTKEQSQRRAKGTYERTGRVLSEALGASRALQELLNDVITDERPGAAEGLVKDAARRALDNLEEAGKDHAWARRKAIEAGVKV